jgi:hypothetical protein
MKYLDKEMQKPTAKGLFGVLDGLGVHRTNEPGSPGTG